MSKASRALALFTIMTVGAAGAAYGAAPAANAICHDPALSRQEQTLCLDQIAKAQSVPEQKKVQAKFKERVDKRKPK